MSTYYYYGKGPVYIGPYGGGGSIRPLGNASKLELAVSEETKELLDYQSAGGGKAAVISRITGVTAAITALDFKPENLAIALRGTAAAVTTGAVSDEAHVAYQGGLVPLAKIPNTAETITVTGEGGTPTYDLTDDYTVTRAGILITVGGAIADETDIEVSYTPLAATRLEALTTSGAQFYLVFDGLNEAESGKAVVVRLHKCQFSPTAGLGLIADDFGNLEMSCEVLADATITGQGLSQYLQADLAA